MTPCDIWRRKDTHSKWLTLRPWLLHRRIPSHHLTLQHSCHVAQTETWSKSLNFLYRVFFLIRSLSSLFHQLFDIRMLNQSKKSLVWWLIQVCLLLMGLLILREKQHYIIFHTNAHNTLTCGFQPGGSDHLKGLQNGLPKECKKINLHLFCTRCYMQSQLQ